MSKEEILKSNIIVMLMKLKLHRELWVYWDPSLNNGQGGEFVTYHILTDSIYSQKI